MARDYHPLDSRYKGPSTAYTGTGRPIDAVAAAPNPVQANPWTPPPARNAPPPLPTPRAQPARSGRTGLRILLGIIVVILIVGSNFYATRSYSSLMTDVEAQMNALEL